MNVVEIPLIEIDNTDRVRSEFGDLDGLKTAILGHGLYQAITIRTHPDPDSTYKYKLVAGGRRLCAFQSLAVEHPKKFHTIPAVIREDTDDLTALEIEMLENIARKDLTWQEKVDQVHRLDVAMKKKSRQKKDGTPAKYWGMRDTAKLIGVSTALVHRQLKLHEMMTVMPDLRKLDTEDKAVMAARKIIEQSEIKKASAQRRELLAQHEDVDDDDESDDEETTANIKDLAKERFKRFAGKFLKKADSNYRVGDALEGLSEMIAMKEEGVSPPITLCEVDPPYGINLIDQKKGEGVERDEYNEIPKADYAAWTFDLTEKLYAALPDDCNIVYWFAYEWYETIRTSLTKSGFVVDSVPCVWIKASGQTNDPEHYLARAHEPFFHARKGNPLIRKRGRSNVFSAENITLKDKFHPTQRPVNLMREIIETFTFPNTIICSPFLGSGATLLAAYKENCMAFGWDLSEQYKEGFMRSAQGDIEWHLANSLKSGDERVVQNLNTQEEGHG